MIRLDTRRVLDNLIGSMASIAIIENDDDNRDVLQALLESQGHTVQPFTTGKDFLSVLVAPHLFRLILIDLSMPDMDGYELLDMVRRQDPDVPVMAVTGRAGLGDRSRAQAAGFSDFVTKPLTDLPTFYALIIKHLNHHLTPARLLALADRDDIVFTLEEFNHLKTCSHCFTHWAANIRELQSQHSKLSDG